MSLSFTSTRVARIGLFAESSKPHKVGKEISKNSIKVSVTPKFSMKSKPKAPQVPTVFKKPRAKKARVKEPPVKQPHGKKARAKQPLVKQPRVKKPRVKSASKKPVVTSPADSRTTACGRAKTGVRKAGAGQGETLEASAPIRRTIFPCPPK